MKRKHPELYAMLERVFHQDPQSPGQKSSGVNGETPTRTAGPKYSLSMREREEIQTLLFVG